MATAKVQYNTLVSKLSLPDSADEISALAFAVLQHLGVSRTDILSDREVHLNQDQLQSVIERLNQHEPVQYIFNEAWFYGRKFFVDSKVLIPRPETELIIDIAKKNFSKTDVFSVLDIGTGSGCIAVTLALEFPNAKITATDVSVSALQVAQRNANNLGATVNFIGHDILKGFSSDSKCDLLVSNPPYIAHSEKASIPQNVLQYEPHLALFAAEDDALIFYRAIFKSAWAILKIGQLLAVEINERLAVQVVQMLELMGFSAIEIHQDIYGKDRVVTARMV
jgi:release factor glutamine methyltransferase